MARTNKTLRWVLSLLLTAAMIGGIWFFSLENATDSAMRSDKIIKLLEKLFGLDAATMNVRKIAHFVEYAILGGWMMALLWINGKIRMQNLVNILFIGLLTAVADESIQMFTGRVASVSDILLDGAGFVCGLAVVALIRSVSVGLRSN